MLKATIPVFAIVVVVVAVSVARSGKKINGNFSGCPAVVFLAVGTENSRIEKREQVNWNDGYILNLPFIHFLSMP